MYRPCLHCGQKEYDKEECPKICTYGENRKYIGECEKAEKDGTLIKLPCAVGTTVYSCVGLPEVCVGTVQSFSVSDSLDMYVRYTNGLTYWHRASDVGKEVFLTEEDAEKALIAETESANRPLE